LLVFIDDELRGVVVVVSESLEGVYCVGEVGVVEKSRSHILRRILTLGLPTKPTRLTHPTIPTSLRLCPSRSFPSLFTTSKSIVRQKYIQFFIHEKFSRQGFNCKLSLVSFHEFSVTQFHWLVRSLLALFLLFFK
jgi:hypothetical protein